MVVEINLFEKECFFIDSYIYQQGTLISSQWKTSDHFGNMLLKACDLIVLAFVSLVSSKCQSRILLRKAFEYFHVNITIITYSHLKDKQRKKNEKEIHSDASMPREISFSGTVFLDQNSQTLIFINLPPYFMRKDRLKAWQEA